jgi:hypothetical protein
VRRHERNAVADPIIEALMAAKVPEIEARAWVTNLEREERKGFCIRVSRRLGEASVYHARKAAPGDHDLLDGFLVRQIMEEECAR